MSTRAFGGLSIAAVLMLTACESQPRNISGQHSEMNAQAGAANLMAIQLPAGSDADQRRATLARFIGVWTFQGSVLELDGSRRTVSGEAAAAIEEEHFVKIDLRATSGALAGYTGKKGGTMLLASEPDVGLTLTAWGDASPAITRMTGTQQNRGQQFLFEEVRTPAGRSRHQLAIGFETDHRWTAEIRDLSNPGGPAAATYTFTRVME